MMVAASSRFTALLLVTSRRFLPNTTQKHDDNIYRVLDIAQPNNNFDGGLSQRDNAQEIGQMRTAFVIMRIGV